MSSAPIYESRRIGFSLEAVIECILEADRDMGGKLWRSKPGQVTLIHEPALSLRFIVTKPGDSQASEIVWTGVQIAAAMIRLCGRLRIPLQRSANKRVEASEGRLTLITESCLHLPRTLGTDFDAVLQLAGNANSSPHSATRVNGSTAPAQAAGSATPRESVGR